MEFGIGRAEPAGGSPGASGDFRGPRGAPPARGASQGASRKEGREGLTPAVARPQSVEENEEEETD